MADAPRRAVLGSLLLVVAAAVAAPGPASAERRRSLRSGWIEVVSLTLGAEVVVNGLLVGVVPLPRPIAVAPGEHTVKVRRRGFTQHLEVVTVRSRQVVTVEADLLALSGILQVRSDVEGVRVFVDGEYLGTTPVDREVAPGQRRIRFARSGYRDSERIIEVVAGEVRELAANLEFLGEAAASSAVTRRRPWYRKWWVWVIVGAVVVATAVTVPLVAISDDDECAEITNWPSCDHGTVIQVPVGR